MGIIVLIVLFTNYKSKNSDWGFGYIIFNLLPFELTVIYKLFFNYTSMIGYQSEMQEHLMYVFMIIWQGGCYSIISLSKRRFF